MDKFETYSDEELICILRSGHSEVMDYLLNKYKNLVKSLAGSYYLPGADEQDILQEGMIGLFKAVRDFDVNKDASFATFARICIQRNIQTAVQKANRKKQDPLNSSVSLNAAAEDGAFSENDGMSAEALKRIGVNNPEEILIDRENYMHLRSAINRDLSGSEREVFERLLQGLTYTEIAERLSKTPKSVDNAITRIKNKAKKYVTV